MCLLAEVLLAGSLLVGILPLEVLLAAEGEMVLVVSVFLEKREKILPELEIPGEEEALLLSGALFVLWYSRHLFSSADWTGGIGTCASGFCRCADIEREIYEYKCNRCKTGIGMKKFENIP